MKKIMDKKIVIGEVIFLIIALVGLALPVISVSYMGLSESISYMDAADVGKLPYLIAASLGLAIAQFFKKADNIKTKIGLMLSILGSEGLLVYDMYTAFKDVKTIAPNVQVDLKIGCFVMAGCLLLTLVVVIFDTFIKSNKGDNDDAYSPVNGADPNFYANSKLSDMSNTTTLLNSDSTNQESSFQQSYNSFGTNINKNEINNQSTSSNDNNLFNNNEIMNKNN